MFYETPKQHCRHPSSKFIFWQEKHDIGFNSTKCSEHIYMFLFIFLIFWCSLCCFLFSAFLSLVGTTTPFAMMVHWKLKVKFAALVLKWAKLFLREQNTHMKLIQLESGTNAISALWLCCVNPLKYSGFECGKLISLAVIDERIWAAQCHGLCDGVFSSQCDQISISPSDVQGAHLQPTMTAHIQGGGFICKCFSHSIKHKAFKSVFLMKCQITIFGSAKKLQSTLLFFFLTWKTL